MKFECEKSLFSAAIDGAARAVTSRAAIPVLEGLLLKAEGFSLTLTGYDMEMGITTTIECNVLEPGETVLDARLLGSMVARMPGGTVRVELGNGGMARISCGDVEFEIASMMPGEFPALPITGAEETMKLTCGTLREMVEKTIYAVAQDDKKPAHTGELFVIAPGQLTVVALDGYRLAIVKRAVECDKELRIIVPAKTLQELLKLMGGPDDEVRVEASRRYVVFTTCGYTLISRLIEGEFLNYETVIPKGAHTTVRVNTRAFSETIERASLVITERLKNPLRITFDGGRITVRCQTSIGKFVDGLAAEKMEGEAVEIGFNNRYLLDALRNSRNEEVVFELNGALSPVKVLPGGDEGDFTYLVLPVRFKNEG